LLVQGHALGSVVQPPASSSHASIVQAMPSLQTTWLPRQVPAVQTSNTVQTSPSLQPVPSWSGGKLHWPVAGSHVPTSWQSSAGRQLTGLPATQAPDWQASLCVHASPSSQPVPSLAAIAAHVPFARLQRARWQTATWKVEQSESFLH
jgi:hypothetical protein